MNRKAIGLFKALELTNASIRQGYKVNKEFAQKIREKVLESVTLKKVVLDDEYDLTDDFVLIEEGLTLFNLGRKNKQYWKFACEYSEKLCRDYQKEIKDGLDILVNYFEEYPLELREFIIEKFL